LYKVGGGRNLNAVFRIRHAAEMAGISTSVLRAWERRYRLVRPTRTASGYRAYSEEDVRLLRAAVKLVAAGHSISDVARLPPAQIHAEAAALATIRTTREPGRGVEAALGEAVAAARAFDRERFEAALFPVLTAGGLTPVAACEEILLPLLRLIGEGWERGTLSVAAEHFGSALVRAKILHYLEFLGRTVSGSRLVCACPGVELHEGGLMAFAVHAAALGWRVVYLGASTPIDQAVETATRVQAEVLALSLTIPATAAELESLLAVITEKKPPGLRVLVGGTTALAHRTLFEKAQVIVAERISVSLGELKAALRP
jgi:DNA-binding transcriptional MerR regulator/methylmalonyl-CoA mutase cobalamin-binding subunit